MDIDRLNSILKESGTMMGELISGHQYLLVVANGTLAERDLRELPEAMKLAHGVTVSVLRLMRMNTPVSEQVTMFEIEGDSHGENR